MSTDREDAPSGQWASHAANLQYYPGEMHRLDRASFRQCPGSQQTRFESAKDPIGRFCGR
jgi:hypothetical protein